MKRYITLLFIIIAVQMQSQTTLNLNVDVPWHDVGLKWYPYGTTFYNFQGDLISAVYSPVKLQAVPQIWTAYPSFYFCNANTGTNDLVPLNFGLRNINYIDYYGYPGETGAEHECKPIGKTFFFEFNERLWYFQHVHANYYTKKKSTGSVEGLINKSYMCFAEMPTTTDANWYTYYDTYSPVPDINPMGAVQLDTLLYFISLNQNTSSPNYNKWFLQECKFSGQRFVRIRDIMIGNIAGDRLGGIIAQTSSVDSTPYLIINTYSSVNHTSYIGMLHTSRVNNQNQFNFVSYPYISSNAGATTIVLGSIKGSRSTSTYVDPYPNYSNRFAFYSVDYDGINTNHHLHYIEYYIKDDTPHPLTIGEIVMPSTLYPHKKDGELNVEGSFATVMDDYSGDIPGKDGLQKWSWFFYPDPNGKIGGGSMKSDVWRIIPGSAVSSNDLGDTTLYGQDIKSLWTLVGIVEGAPPAVVNWNTWNKYHSSNELPSSLMFHTMVATDTASSATGYYGASFSYGSTANVQPEKDRLSFSSQYKFSSNHHMKETLATINSFGLSQLFDLDSLTQQYGGFIYAIPEMIRFSYQVYPWYDANWSYPVFDSYQFMWRVTGMSLKTEKVYLYDEPFNIPNTVSNQLQYWNKLSRTQLWNSVKNTTPVNISWSDGFHGTTDILRRGKDSTSTYAWTIGYQKTLTVGIGSPEVFSKNISYGKDVNYGGEVKIKTFFGNRIETSLNNMYHKYQGLNMSYLSVDTYILKPEYSSTYWFYDKLDGQKPWYIAYIVGSCTAQINAQNPPDGACLEKSNLFFSWTSDPANMKDYTLYITDEPFVNPTTILCSVHTGGQTAVIPDGFVPAKGRTYYWQVRGTSPDGDVVWSKPVSFRYSCSYPDGEQETITAHVYPNPGKSSEIRLLVDQKVNGADRVEVSVYDTRGALLGMKEYGIRDGGAITVPIPVATLAPGIYFAHIRAGEAVTVRKVFVK